MEDFLGTVVFVKTLLRDFTEGGAEYFRIPQIRYRNAPLYFLLNPGSKPPGNVGDFTVEGRVRYSRVFYGRTFYGTILPDEELQGSEDLWLLASGSIFPQGNTFVSQTK